nr:probable aquaporin NIP7-1 [Ipomoea batatas]
MKGDGETACFDVSIETTSSSSSCERLRLIKKCNPMQALAPMKKQLSTAREDFAVSFPCLNKIFIRELMGVQVGLLEYAATASLTVVVVVFSIGPISGAHINPSVTLAFASLGPFPWPKVPFYIMAQVGGSVFATISSRLIYGVEYEHMMTRPLHGCNAAFWVEFLATFLILFLAASMSSDPQFNDYKNNITHKTILILNNEMGILQTGKLAGFVVGVCIGLGVLISG